MKENFDKALRLFCDKADSFRPVMLNPFCKEGWNAGTNGKIILAIKNHETYPYYKEGDYRVPNITHENIMPRIYSCSGYLNVSKLESALKDGGISYNIGSMNFKGENLALVVKASGLLGITNWKVDVAHQKLILLADNDNIFLLVMPWCEKGKEIELDNDGDTSIEVNLAKESLQQLEKEERERAEEAKRKQEEYERSHRKIWKILVERIEVGYLLIEAPDEDTAFEIAEKEASEAEFCDDYEYEVRESDFEEDIDHYEIKTDYKSDYIVTPEKTENGYKFVKVRNYKHFDKDED